MLSERASRSALADSAVLRTVYLFWWITTDLLMGVVINSLDASWELEVKGLGVTVAIKQKSVVEVASSLAPVCSQISCSLFNNVKSLPSEMIKDARNISKWKFPEWHRFPSVLIIIQNYNPDLVYKLTINWLFVHRGISAWQHLKGGANYTMLC